MMKTRISSRSCAKQERNSIVSDIEAAMRENNVLDDPLSQAVLEVNRRHAELVSHPRGIFPDSRLTGSEQGWRVGEQAVYLCIYRKASERFWKNRSAVRHSSCNTT